MSWRRFWTRTSKPSTRASTTLRREVAPVQDPLNLDKAWLSADVLGCCNTGLSADPIPSAFCVQVFVAFAPPINSVPLESMLVTELMARWPRSGSGALRGRLFLWSR